MTRHPSRSLSRSLSLITPSGHLTLGNYLGALCPMAARQAVSECYFGVSDLHALTTPQDPAELRRRVVGQQRLMLAAGLDESTLFVQSHVPAHCELAYLLECVATTGELNRMVQFKEKGRDQPSTRASLFTYPVLMAADILLYAPQEVPVGDDQRQHVELARDVAQRFNTTYGEVLVVPEVTTPPVGARVMDLADPSRKMAKSSASAAGSILLLDPPDVVRRKVARAVTDSETGPDAVRADRDAKPGVTNLIDILAACGGSAEGVRTYGGLKSAVTDAVVAVLEPLQQRYADLDGEHVGEVFAAGERRCREVTAAVLADVRRAMGL